MYTQTSTYALKAYPQNNQKEHSNMTNKPKLKNPTTSMSRFKKMTPKKIVKELDRDVVGQNDAKKAVAIALRNRWRRMNTDELRNEISPKNILMIGPTGVGKTEISRRISRLVEAPFIKVEATKFTEVGYVGRDVDSIIRDLVDISIKMTREVSLIKVQKQAVEAAQERVIDALLPSSGKEKGDKKKKHSETREVYRKKLKSGELDDRMIEIETGKTGLGVEIMAPAGMEDMTSQLQNIFQNLNMDKTKLHKMKISEALKQLKEEEASKLLNEEEIKQQAVESAEQNGIVFLDEIDKVIRSSERGHGDVSREGVQRDLLPLLEGTSIATKYGTIKTDHILFIASGAFMGVQPSDMISELQGRLPIRVELKALTESDFQRILVEPNASLAKQYQALMKTEGVELKFSKSGIARIAAIACHVNNKSDNIGARRLHTIMEKMLEEISFNADSMSGQTINIDAAYVNKQLDNFIQDEDLSRWIL